MFRTPLVSPFSETYRTGSHLLRLSVTNQHPPTPLTQQFNYSIFHFTTNKANEGNLKKHKKGPHPKDEEPVVPPLLIVSIVQSTFMYR